PRSATSRLLEFEAFVRDFQRFHRGLAGFRVQGGALQLARPALREGPAQRRLARLVQQHDRSRRPLRLAVDYRLAPRIKVGVDDSALAYDLVVLHQPRQLAHGRDVAALAVFDDVGVHGEAADFAEATLRNAIDLHDEVELRIRIVAASICHEFNLLATRSSSRLRSPRHPTSRCGRSQTPPDTPARLPPPRSAGHFRCPPASSWSGRT